MKLVAEYKLENLCDSLFDTQAGDWRRHIRSIDAMDQRILIGTKGSEIFEIRAPTHSPSDGVSTDEKILNLHHGPLVQVQRGELAPRNSQTQSSDLLPFHVGPLQTRTLGAGVPAATSTISRQVCQRPVQRSLRHDGRRRNA